jgi:hypothetical protein
MSVISPHYRFALYSDYGVTYLTPAAGGSHSLPFKITTEIGGSDTTWQPYLKEVTGMKGGIDPFTRKPSTGSAQITMLDKQTGSNIERFVTAFVGDAKGHRQLVGRFAGVWERLTDTSPWVPIFSGFVNVAELDHVVKYTMTLRDLAQDLEEAKVFTDFSAPGTSGNPFTYAPLGFLYASAGSPGVTPLNGTTSWQNTGTTVYQLGMSEPGFFQVDTTDADTHRRDNVFVKNLTGAAPYRNTCTPEQLKNTEVRVRLISSNPADAWHGKEGRAYEIKLGPQYDPAPTTTRASLFFLHPGFSYDWMKLTNLPNTDPQYYDLSQVPRNVSIKYVIYKPGKNGLSDLGMFTTDIEPTVFLGELLDGKYGFQKDGVPLDPFSYNFHGITVGSRSRWHITEESTLAEFIQKYICLPYGLAYFMKPAMVGNRLTCQFNLVDMRRSSIENTVSSLPTLTDDDLIVSRFPKWKHERNGSAKVIRVTGRVTHLQSLVDAAWSPKDRENNEFVTLPLEAFTGSEELSIALDMSNDLATATGTIDIKALGVSAQSDEVIDGMNGRKWVETQCQRTIEDLWVYASNGPAYLEASFLRTNPDVESCQPGDWRKIDCSVTPNTGTRQRGGVRLMQCIERQEVGAELDLTFIDGGDVSLTRDIPTLYNGGIIGTGVSFTVALNTSGDPVQIQVAQTALGASQPAADSALWHSSLITGVKGDNAVAYQDGSYYVSGLSKGTLIWLRARSLSPLGHAGASSAWTNPISVGQTQLLAPLGLAASDITTKTATLTWTNGSTLPLILTLYVAGVAVKTDNLPSGATTSAQAGLDRLGADFTAKLVHVYTDGSKSLEASVSFSLTSAPAPSITAPAVYSVSVLHGGA